MNSQPNQPLERQLISILAANRENAYATQGKRSDVLMEVARAVVWKFGLQKWDNLKAKHVQYVVDGWKQADTGHRTIEQKLSHFRWLLGKIGKPILLPRSNTELGIEPGARYTRSGKTVTDEWMAEKLEAVADLRIRAMMLLARYVGLRFEEATLFRPWKDWDGTRIWVKRGSKGGRPRYLFPHNPHQIDALQFARSLTTRDGALIPPEVPTYEKWRQSVLKRLRDVGVSREAGRTFHDIRRTYIVERMLYLIDVKKMAEHNAATLVSREVGHGRTEVLKWYCDRLEGY